VQTADNHHPFNLPTEDKDFVKRIVPSDTLKKYGFESLKEFQAFCYTDYCYKTFIEEAKKHPYFSNTVFVFVGDHGVEGESGQMYPDAWTTNRLSDEHIPLLFYAPGILKAQRHSEVVSQIDVLPTIAGMLRQPYTNTTLGRDVLNMEHKTDAAFIIHHDEGYIGVVNNDYYYIKNIWIKNEQLVPVRSNQINLSAGQQDSVKKKMSELTSAIYETAKWMLVHNKGK
jgi:phosphoglycerol transferase MdoB-like AlkP superfamily enzyme